MYLDMDRTALIIIDMQQYQAGEGGNLPRSLAVFAGPEAEAGAVWKGQELIPIIQELLFAFRSAGGKVIYTAFGSLAQDGSDLVPYARYWNERTCAEIGVPSVVSVYDPGYMIVPELGPCPDEPIINKTAQGAFNSSNVDYVLKQMGVDTLVVTGMYTNHCVMATCIGAADSGYRVYVPEDAVGTWNEDLHQMALQLLVSWVTITSSSEVLVCLQRSQQRRVSGDQIVLHE
jgi:nicotinamidase-related amidase